MKQFFKKLSFAFAILMSVSLFSCTGDKYEYQTFENDPMNTKLYTMPNGMKVYMSVNKEEPRIQANIAVRVGGKNDPAETTGLAHYFEHLMFKGTPDFGTLNYEKEKPLLDEIEQLFEIRRKTTDEAERAELYRRIDSLSYEASKYSIPNEYDKLMSAIGAEGTNAYTSYDVTCFVENIPSNEIENWAKVQANRFEFPVIRGFHTELETIYEEKNMSLTKDNRKMIEAMLQMLYPHHPYGTQTVLGTQDDLKNPSITNVKNYHKQWYVPNNMAVCVSGDFDPDNMIDILTKYFGHLQPNNDLPVLKFEPEAPIAEPQIRDVYGLDAEHELLAWRFPGASSREVEVLEILSNVLYNGKAGLIDLDLNQSQKTLYSYATTYAMSDYTSFMVAGAPNQGQTLEEVRALLLQEIEKLRKGEFDESLLQATINNYKLSEQSALESNNSRVEKYIDCFVNGSDWADEVGSLDRMAKITKQDIVDFANKYLTDKNFVAVNKRQGVDKNEKKMAKPELTPIIVNRDSTSTFLKELVATNVEPIEPVFLDFNKDLTKLTAQSDIEVLYKQNTTNDIFSLVYLFEMGSNNDPKLGLAAEYLDYLGTADKTPEQIKNEFYNIACDFSVSPGSERTFVTLSGLSENMPQAVAMFEDLMANAVADKNVYNSLVQQILKGRADSKLNQQANFSALQNYMIFGPENARTNILSKEELETVNPDELTAIIKDLNSYKHRILYYGPLSGDELLASLKENHKVPETLKDIPAGKKFEYQKPEKTIVFVAPYNAKQLYMTQYSNRGEQYNTEIEPARILYNQYFGGGMNAIVFQEMRESRSLAYSAWANFSAPAKLDRPYIYQTMIATQNDKMADAVNAFNEIINNMPVSESAFNLAKDGLITTMRTDRINKSSVLWAYISAQDLGLDVDRRIARFDAIQKLTLDDVVKFQQENIKDRTYYYCILGDVKDLDMKALKKLGEVRILKQSDIFGY